MDDINLPPLPAIDDYLPTDGPRWTTANFIACVERYATDYARAALAAAPAQHPDTADAERYRWLRDCATVGTVHLQTPDGWAHYGSGADEVVDAARAQAQKG